MLHIAVLKTEGDILMDLLQFDRAIKCNKKIKDYCDDIKDNFNSEPIKMKMYEQIAICYFTAQKY
jgi:hypothetical protein